MRTKILEGFQPASIYYRSRWDGHGIRLYYICCLLHLPIRYQALPAVRGRDRPARLRVWAGTRAPVTQTPPVSQWALCIQHPLWTIPKNATSCNSCIGILWVQQGNWAPSDLAGHGLPTSFSNYEVSLESICLYHWHQFSFLPFLQVARVLPWHLPPQGRLYILQDSGPCCEWSSWNSWTLAYYSIRVFFLILLTGANRKLRFRELRSVLLPVIPGT